MSSHGSPCVLLTRPGDLNTGLANLLSRRGVPTLIRPLLEIHELIDVTHNALLMKLDEFDRVIFVSRHAAQFGMTLLDRFWPQWPLIGWYAVGNATSAVLQEYGVIATCPERESSEGLLALPDLEQVDGEKILIVRGRGGRDYLATQLRLKGASVVYLEVYERIGVQYGPALGRDMERAHVNTAVLTSAAMVEQFSDSLTDGELAKLCIVVPSERVAEVARKAGCLNLYEARGTGDEALLQAVITALGATRS